MKLKEIFLAGETLAKTEFLSYKRDQVELPNKKKSIREVIEHPGGVVIAPFDTRAGAFVFVRQYRYAVQEELLEFPAGRLNQAEDPLKAAQRELLEETGYKTELETLKSLGLVYTAPGFCNEKLFLYLADSIFPGEPEPDQDEFVEVLLLNKNQIREKINSGEIRDAKTLAIWGILAAKEF